MNEEHRYGPLLMNVPREIIYRKWVCTQQDGPNDRHYVEVIKPPIMKGPMG